MRKSITMSGTAVAVAAWALLPVVGHQAAAQSGQFYVITADVEIVAADFDKYVALAKENAAASIKDPGCHEFNIAVSPKNLNHVYTFEIYVSAVTLPRLTNTRLADLPAEWSRDLGLLPTERGIRTASLLTTVSVFRETGFCGTETKAPNGHFRSNEPAAETERTLVTPPIRGHLYETPKSPFVWDCVVGPGVLA